MAEKEETREDRRQQAKLGLRRRMTGFGGGLKKGGLKAKKKKRSARRG